MGLVHHAAYLPWMEEARVEWLRALGHPYDELRRQGIEFPVVEVAVRYRRPFRFDDLVDLHLVAASVGRRLLPDRLPAQLRRPAAGHRRHAARGGGGGREAGARPAVAAGARHRPLTPARALTWGA